jgi:hypothetical protein
VVIKEGSHKRQGSRTPVCTVIWIAISTKSPAVTCFSSTILAEEYLSLSFGELSVVVLSSTGFTAKLGVQSFSAAV